MDLPLPCFEIPLSFPSQVAGTAPSPSYLRCSGRPVSTGDRVSVPCPGRSRSPLRTSPRPSCGRPGRGRAAQFPCGAWAPRLGPADPWAVDTGCRMAPSSGPLCLPLRGDLGRAGAAADGAHPGQLPLAACVLAPGGVCARPGHGGSANGTGGGRLGVRSQGARGGPPGTASLPSLVRAVSSRGEAVLLCHPRLDAARAGEGRLLVWTCWAVPGRREHQV